MSTDVRAAAERLLSGTALEYPDDFGDLIGFEKDILTVARAVLDGEREVAALMGAVRKILCAEIIGESVHTALRKNCDGGMEAHSAVARMPRGEWPRAMEAVARGLVEYIEREARAALAAPTTAGGPADPQVAGHLWSMRSRPENETLSVMKACCDLPQTAHAGVTWAELHVYADELRAAWLEADDDGPADPDSGGRGETR